jgi:Zn/Cd-binding protein ZinT
MQLNIELIEEYASLFFTIDEIAMLLDGDTQELRREIKANTTEAAKAYYRGKLKTQIELRKQTLNFARKGSPQAEAAMIDFLKKQNLSENA